jgi:hypothetical protein
VRIWLRFGNGEDLGPLLIAASPFVSPGRVAVNDLTKATKVVEQGRVDVTYLITVKADGINTVFSLEGGGVT